MPRLLCFGVFVIAAHVAVGAAAAAEIEITGDSLRHRDFGVGIITVTFPVDAVDLPVIKPDVASVYLVESEGRILYPAFMVNDKPYPASESVSAKSIRAYYRFRGPESPNVKLHIAGHAPVQPPGGIKTSFADLEALWWEAFSLNARERAKADEFPPQVENYLTLLWARRLATRPPSLATPWSGHDAIDRSLGLLMGAESIRTAMQRSTVLGDTERRLKADQLLPSPARTPPVELPDFDEVPFEPIANHVPPDCFYVRFGSFANFRWMRQAMEKWGGSTRDLVAIRGIRYHLHDRLEQQLALRETALSKLFGDAVISDVAAIGTDPFFRAGAGWGIVFEARNGAVLKSQISKLRRDVLAANSAAEEQKLTIQKRSVSFIATPDNRVRSFYVIDGDYHLVTTSREIVEQFLLVADGEKSLGDLREFRYGRHKMPHEESQALFIYMSDPFFRQLIGPKYRVEMTRRMRAVAEIELVEIARLAAKAEGVEIKSVSDLMNNDPLGGAVHIGYLPPDFLTRPDDSRTIIQEDGQVVDSLRGARGSFLPVLDAQVTRVTDAEFNAYERFRRAYERQWTRMDPVIIAMSRKPIAGTKQERLTFDIHITPYARRQYADLVRGLLPAGDVRLAPIKSDLASVDGHFRLGGLSGYGFAGLRDHTPNIPIKNGRADVRQVSPGEFAAYFSMIAHDRYREIGPDTQGDDVIAGSPFVTQPIETKGDWPRTIRQELKMVKTPRPVQLGVRINDLGNREITPMLDTLGYLQARRTSSSNARFMAVLSDQLKVAPVDAFAVAKRVLGGTPICPLQGEYKLQPTKGGRQSWTSTAWAKPSYVDEDAAPADYEFPFLRWFHGLDLEFNIDATSISSRLELIVE